jgi:hypothetical protein
LNFELFPSVEVVAEFGIAIGILVLIENGRRDRAGGFALEDGIEQSFDSQGVFGLIVDDKRSKASTISGLVAQTDVGTGLLVLSIGLLLQPSTAMLQALSPN